MNTEAIRKQLRRYADKRQAKALQRFFKTGPGEYAEGDIFIGVKVPDVRKVARQYRDIGYNTICSLLKSGVHEERLLALLILISRYRREDQAGREKIYRLYLSHTKYINNWDLVDVTAKHIVGAFLMDKDKGPVFALARSGSLWERRIAVLAAFHFIGRGRCDDALKIAAILLSDRHDLIHKAVGWMLREVGKRDITLEEEFLARHIKDMPRTMLRYAIERFPEPKRKAYLKKR